MILSGCGRDLGKVTATSQDGKNFAVRNSTRLVRMNHREYFVWQTIRGKRNLIKWERDMILEYPTYTLSELIQYKRFMIEHSLIIDLNAESMDDPVFKQYQVTKNGEVAGKDPKSQCWIFNSQQPETGGKVLTDEQYRMWRSATGISTMYDVLRRFQQQTQEEETLVVKKFLFYLDLFYKQDLWTIEYFPEQAEQLLPQEVWCRTVESSLFEVSLVSDQTKLISIGEELGPLDLEIEAEGYVGFVVGKTEVIVGYDEYLVWRFCRIGINTIEEMTNQFHVNQWMLRKSIEQLFEKRLLMIWPNSWKMSDDIFISAHPSGRAIGTINDEDYIMQDIEIGSQIQLPSIFYVPWYFSNGFIPLSVLRDRVQQTFQCTKDLAAEIIGRSIPVLMERGFLHLHIAPINNI